MNKIYGFWIDPKGNTYQINDEFGHKVFMEKYFHKTFNSDEDVYNQTLNEGWIRVVNKKFESYDVDGSKFNELLKDRGITPDDILKRFIEFYLTANLIPIPLCKSVFKDFASEKSKNTSSE